MKIPNDNLVILIGSPRGNALVWKTLDKYVLKEQNADLAICFTDNYDKNEYSKLKQLAKYDWSIKDYNNWETYYRENYSSNILKFFDDFKDNAISGGLNEAPGAGAILLAQRDTIFRKHLTKVKNYNQIILTRSDYLYIDKHPQLNNSYIWIPDGEDFGGINDRYWVFSSEIAEKVLGICDYLDKTRFKRNSIINENLEGLLLTYLKDIGILKKVNRFNYFHFLVKTENDATKHSPGEFKIRLLGKVSVKYVSEFKRALTNVDFKNNIRKFNPTNLIIYINFLIYAKFFKKRIDIKIYKRVFNEK